MSKLTPGTLYVDESGYPFECLGVLADGRAYGVLNHRDGSQDVCAEDSLRPPVVPVTAWGRATVYLHRSPEGQLSVSFVPDGAIGSVQVMLIEGRFQ